MTKREFLNRQASLNKTISLHKRRFDSTLFELQRTYDELNKKDPDNRPYWVATVDGKYVGSIDNIIRVNDSKGRFKCLNLVITTHPGKYSEP